MDGAQADRITDALSCIRVRGFEIAVSGVGYFEKKRKAHTLWAGVTPGDPLAALHQKIDHALVAIGLAPEHRAYRPHITLARLSRPPDALAPFLQRHADFSTARFALDNVALFESLPSPEGRIYRPMFACSMV